MKTIKKIKIFLLALIFFVGCTEDSSSESCGDELVALTETMQENLTVYTNNPTTYNCNAWRTSWLACYDKIVACGGNTSALGQSRESVLAMDCSSGGGTTNYGTLMVWTNLNKSITVTCNGQTRYITSYYTTVPSGCNATGCAIFSLPYGTYTLNGSSNGTTWGPSSVTINSSCFKFQFY